MGLTAIAHGQRATIKLPPPWDTSVIWGTTAWSTSISVYDVTGVRNGVNDTSSILINDSLGRIQGLSIGTPFSGSTYSHGYNAILKLLDNSTATEIEFKAFDFKYKKEFPLRDITASESTEKRYTCGRPKITLATRGYIPTNEDKLGDLSSTGLVRDARRTLDAYILIDEVGTLRSSTVSTDSDLRVQSIVKRMPLKPGGEIEVNMLLAWSGDTDYTKAVDNNNLKLDGADREPDSGNIVIDMDDGETITHNVIINSVELSASPQKGSPVEARVGWVFSELLS